MKYFLEPIKYLCAIFALALFSCQSEPGEHRVRLDLSGTWEFALDTVDVGIPENFKDKNLALVFERSKSSKIWIDRSYVGESHLLQSPQKSSNPRGSGSSIQEVG